MGSARVTVRVTAVEIDERTVEWQCEWEMTGLWAVLEGEPAGRVEPSGAGRLTGLGPSGDVGREWALG